MDKHCPNSDNENYYSSSIKLSNIHFLLYDYTIKNIHSSTCLMWHFQGLDCLWLGLALLSQSATISEYSQLNLTCQATKILLLRSAICFLMFLNLLDAKHVKMHKSISWWLMKYLSKNYFFLLFFMLWNFTYILKLKCMWNSILISYINCWNNISFLIFLQVFWTNFFFFFKKKRRKVDAVSGEYIRIFEYWAQQYSQYSLCHIEWDLSTGC